MFKGELMRQLTHLERPLSSDDFYRDLTSRNQHFVSKATQERLRTFKILIAGCGSTGGACIEALARVGVCNFWLADNGSYELSNLNRQHARLENIGENKAQFHAAEIARINPHAHVTVDTRGICAENVEAFVQAADLVFDAVDVTTPAGIRAKVLLHQKCHQFKKPVWSGLDLGYLQWGCSFDYRQKMAVLNGAEGAALKAAHPIAALFKIYPIGILPGHAAALMVDLMEERCDFASQMGCTSDALSAVIVPAVLKFVGHGILISGWRVDLAPYRFTWSERVSDWLLGVRLRAKLRRWVSAN
jgi:hypothetical protein